MPIESLINVDEIMTDVQTSANYALKYIKNDIVSDIDMYVPYKTGRTSRSGYDSAEIVDNELLIEYEGVNPLTGYDYTENIYEGVSSAGKSVRFIPGRNPGEKSNPFAGPYWDERAINDNKIKWRNDIIDTIEHQRLLWREQAKRKREKKLIIEFK